VLNNDLQAAFRQWHPGFGGITRSELAAYHRPDLVTLDGEPRTTYPGGHPPASFGALRRHRGSRLIVDAKLV
jgi:hypothetical protein